MCSKYVLSLSGLTWFSRPMQWRGNSRYNPCAPLCRANSCWCAEPSIVSGDRWSNEWRCLLEGWVKSWLPRDEWFSRCKANIQYMYLVEDQANTRQQGVTADLEKFLGVRCQTLAWRKLSHSCSGWLLSHGLDFTILSRILKGHQVGRDQVIAAQF